MKNKKGPNKKMLKEWNREYKARILWLELENEDLKLQVTVLKTRQEQILDCLRNA